MKKITLKPGEFTSYSSKPSGLNTVKKNENQRAPQTRFSFYEIDGSDIKSDTAFSIGQINSDQTSSTKLTLETFTNNIDSFLSSSCTLAEKKKKKNINCKNNTRDYFTNSTHSVTKAPTEHSVGNLISSYPTPLIISKKSNDITSGNLGTDALNSDFNSENEYLEGKCFKKCEKNVRSKVGKVTTFSMGNNKKIEKLRSKTVSRERKTWNENRQEEGRKCAHIKTIEDVNYTWNGDPPSTQSSMEKYRKDVKLRQIAETSHDKMVFDFTKIFEKTDINNKNMITNFNEKELINSMKRKQTQPDDSITSVYTNLSKHEISSVGKLDTMMKTDNETMISVIETNDKPVSSKRDKKYIKDIIIDTILYIRLRRQKRLSGIVTSSSPSSPNTTTSNIFIKSPSTIMDNKDIYSKEISSLPLNNKVTDEQKYNPTCQIQYSEKIDLITQSPSQATSSSSSVHSSIQHINTPLQFYLSSEEKKNISSIVPFLTTSNHKYNQDLLVQVEKFENTPPPEVEYIPETSAVAEMFTFLKNNQRPKTQLPLSLELSKSVNNQGGKSNSPIISQVLLSPYHDSSSLENILVESFETLNSDNLSENYPSECDGINSSVRKTMKKILILPSNADSAKSCILNTDKATKSSNFEITTSKFCHHRNIENALLPIETEKMQSKNFEIPFSRHENPTNDDGSSKSTNVRTKSLEEDIERCVERVLIAILNLGTINNVDTTLIHKVVKDTLSTLFDKVDSDVKQEQIVVLPNIPATPSPITDEVELPPSRSMSVVEELLVGDSESDDVCGYDYMIPDSEHLYQDQAFSSQSQQKTYNSTVTSRRCLPIPNLVKEKNVLSIGDSSLSNISSFLPFISSSSRPLDTNLEVEAVHNGKMYTSTENHLQTTKSHQVINSTGTSNMDLPSLSQKWDNTKGVVMNHEESNDEKIVRSFSVIKGENSRGTITMSQNIEYVESEADISNNQVMCSSPSIINSITNVIQNKSDDIVATLSGESSVSSNKTLDNYSCPVSVNNTVLTPGSPTSLSDFSDTEDGMVVHILVRSLYSHIISYYIQRRKYSNKEIWCRKSVSRWLSGSRNIERLSDLAISGISWDDSDPDDPGYIVHSLTESQLKRIELEFQIILSKITCITTKTTSIIGNLENKEESLCHSLTSDPCDKICNDMITVSSDKYKKNSNDRQSNSNLINSNKISVRGSDERGKFKNILQTMVDLNESYSFVSFDNKSSVEESNNIEVMTEKKTSPSFSIKESFIPGNNETIVDNDLILNTGFPETKPAGSGTFGELELYYLPIIYKAHQTGFEPTKDLILKPGAIFAGRYFVQNELGSAAFSTAYSCVDLTTGKLSKEGEEFYDEVCLKVIKNTKDFFDQSLDEIKILELLRQTGKCHEHNIVEMKCFFYHKEHLIITTELLRQNLFEFGKCILENNEPLYFTRPRLCFIARQCFVALNFVHKLGLVHSDIKPENILLSSYSKAKVKVIDFGSSCYLTDRQSSYIQSRSYRAPEVILGLPYDGKIDVWSLGCVIAEMYTGQVVFQNDSIISMLSRIEAICGAFPPYMVKNGYQSRQYFTSSGLLYERLDRNIDKMDLAKKNGQSSPLSPLITECSYNVYQPKVTTMAARLGFEPDLMERRRTTWEDDEKALFVDFMKKTLTIDPNLRPTAAEALEHPWILSGFNLTEEEIHYPPDV